MHSLRWRMIALLLWVALLFNLERLNLGSQDTLNLPTATYVAGLLVAVGSLMPARKRLSLPGLLAAAVGVYTALLLLFPGPDLGGVRTYLSLAGLLLVIVTALLAHLVGAALDEFHAGVETVALAGAGPQLPSLEEASKRIEDELDRTRRIERPISVVKLRIDSATQSLLIHRFVAEITQTLVQRYATTAVAQVTARHLRRNTFVVSDSAPGQLLIIAPETSADQVPVMIERVARAVQAQFGFEPQLAYATLPTDALTFADLHEVIEQRFGGAETPERPLNELPRREPRASSD